MIHKNNISLKTATPADIPWLARIVSNEKVYRRLAPEFAEVTEADVGAALSAAEPGTKTKVFIIIEDGVYIGFITLSNIHPANRTACVGLIALAPEYLGHDRAENAIRAAVEYAFNTLNLRKIYCFCYSDHRATARLAKRCGGKEEAVLREDLYRDGKYHDRIVFGLLRSEYNG
jgi:RimJ/RimL family protein N-acetyltransferase